MARLVLPIALAVSLASLAATVPARAQGEDWQDRRHWDWGQHRTDLAAEEPQEAPPPPAGIHEHWDYPGAPVRFAGQPARG